VQLTICHFNPKRQPKRTRSTQTNTWRTRYKEAHMAWQLQTAPNFVEVGGYVKTVYPKVTTANGLTNAICNYINWCGGVGNRINVMGRLVEGTERTESGAVFAKKKFIKSSTLKGTADIIATLPNGKTWHIEIKVGKDKPRKEQLDMQQRIRKTGSNYDFISDMDTFFSMYDALVNSTLF
jgi:hypothetical protein